MEDVVGPPLPSCWRWRGSGVVVASKRTSGLRHTLVSFWLLYCLLPYGDPWLWRSLHFWGPRNHPSQMGFLSFTAPLMFAQIFPSFFVAKSLSWFQKSRSFVTQQAADVERSTGFSANNKTLPVISHPITSWHLDFLPIVFTGRLQVPLSPPAGERSHCFVHTHTHTYTQKKVLENMTSVFLCD